MKRQLLLPLGFAVACLGTSSPLAAQGARPAPLLWRVGHIVRCARADTMFGYHWRSHNTVLRIALMGDSMLLRTQDRRLPWRRSGSGRLVGTEGLIRLAGHEARSPSPAIEVSIKLLDEIFRASEQARVELIIDTLHAVFEQPTVAYPNIASTDGIPIVVSFALDPVQSLALASAHEVRGTVGPHEFFLYDWELWDLNALYRATVCGLESVQGTS